MKLYVFGAGGFAKNIVSTLLAAGLSVDGLFDDDPQKQGLCLLGVEVVGTIEDARKRGPAQGILAIGNNRTRQLLAREFPEWEWLSVVHPRAYVHPSVSLGSGTVVLAGAVIQPDTNIGAHAIINAGTTLGHDCQVGDFVHLAPGVHLAGHVIIEEGAFIGIGSAVIPKVRVGAWTVVGAGAAVVRDLPPYVTAVGVPAKPKKTVS